MKTLLDGDDDYSNRYYTDSPVDVNSFLDSLDGPDPYDGYPFEDIYDEDLDFGDDE